MNYEFCNVTNQWIPTAAIAPWMYSRGIGYEPWLRPGPTDNGRLVCIHCGTENLVSGSHFKMRDLPGGLCEEVPAMFNCGNCRNDSPVSANLYPWFAQHDFSGWRINRPGMYPGLDAAVQRWQQEFGVQTPAVASPVPQGGNAPGVDMSAVGNAALNIFAGVLKVAGGLAMAAAPHVANGYGKALRRQIDGGQDCQNCGTFIDNSYSGSKCPRCGARR